ncbi:hypothetical protein [Acidithiobacillus ferriphilus]|jgi:hypothetical protein|uniref:hypothetical protein n=1 Tax=Acidithiobacillus ferriphilus TaxID=1689834 RepID=UPI001C06F01F|nr:hypothetical protein [Acidithiobacillus ferriphilus]MBU2854819.1 hypothetical protein [Acidithiobacillus ferriphilus]
MKYTEKELEEACGNEKAWDRLISVDESVLEDPIESTILANTSNTVRIINPDRLHPLQEDVLNDEDEFGAEWLFMDVDN